MLWLLHRVPPSRIRPSNPPSTARTIGISLRPGWSKNWVLMRLHLLFIALLRLMPRKVLTPNSYLAKINKTLIGGSCMAILRRSQERTPVGSCRYQSSFREFSSSLTRVFRSLITYLTIGLRGELCLVCFWDVLTHL